MSQKVKDFILGLLIGTFFSVLIGYNIMIKKTFNGYSLDHTVSPKDDFYRYVNGAWLNSAKIPSDYGAWGGFYELGKNTDADVLEILKQLHYLCWI